MMNPGMARRVLAGLLAVLAGALVLACKPAATTTSTSTSSTPAASAPVLTITQPTGTQFAPGNVIVSVTVTNFTLTDKLGKANVSGQGHLHYFYDVTAPTDPGKPAVTAQGTYAATAATSYTWTNVPSGQHTFSVELVNNDHTPLVPPVVKTVSLLIIPEIGPPNVVIKSPLNGAVLNAGSVTVTVQATNFNLVSKLGQANVQREGHVHYFLDVDPPTAPNQPAVTAQGTYAATADTSYTWTNVPAGSHKLSVELVNNDHTPLSPPVVASVTVVVQASATSSTSTTTATTQASTTTSTTATTPAATGKPFSINLVAAAMAFDQSTITVPSGSAVTVNFANRDTGVLHNFAVYQNLPGGGTKPVFIGQTVTGPANVTYTFSAPAAGGDYFFECDVHPSQMNGKFVVSP